MQDPDSSPATSSETASQGGQRRIRVLDVVALTGDRPEHGLLSGHVGTVVETFDPAMFEVEFSDDAGRTYAQLALPASCLMVLHHRPVSAI